MPRYIDTDNRENIIDDCVLIPQSVWQSVLEKLDKASAEPEIIYCGECKHMMPNGRCSVFADPSIRPSASDYCSNAEKRQDVEDSISGAKMDKSSQLKSTFNGCFVPGK